MRPVTNLTGQPIGRSKGRPRDTGNRRFSGKRQFWTSLSSPIQTTTYPESVLYCW